MIYFQTCFVGVHNFLHRLLEAFAKWESHGSSKGEHGKYFRVAAKGLMAK
jgi:hypothetical protein